ncbi:PAS domain-containing protein, partial [Streptomyces sp. SID6041]|nr:PAS domain-containing protein [Streptomyces sp. SID6041]
LTALLEPEDGYALWAAARQATGPDGRPVVRRIRLKGPDGGLHLLEVSTRARHTAPHPGTYAPPHTDGSGAPRLGVGGVPTGLRLTCTLVDLGTGLIGSDATDRLPRAILAIDRLGRVTYVNELTERLVGRPRAALAGRPLWEALP